MRLWQSQMDTPLLIELNEDLSCRIQVFLQLLKGSRHHLAPRNNNFCFDILFFKKLVLQFLTQPKSQLKHPCCSLRTPDSKRKDLDSGGK